MDDGNLTRLQLDVYMTREGPWNPDHGDIEIPESWDFLPSGDAFVTRRVQGDVLGGVATTREESAASAPAWSLGSEDCDRGGVG